MTMTKKEPKDIMSKISEAERNGSKAKIIDEKYDYDPYEHSPTENSTTYSESLLILLKASLGTGILAMPRAFCNSGYMVGFIGTVIIGFLTTYTIHMIMTAEYELCRRKRVPHMSYPETFEAAFEYGPRRVRKYKNIAWYICYLFLLMYQMGTSCIYLVFIADNVKEEIDLLYGPIEIRMLIVYLLVPLILISLVRKMKLLAPLSSLGHVFAMVCFCIIFYYIFADIPSFSERQPVGTMKGIPLFFGTVLFAMEAIGSVMPVKNEMARPEFFASKFGVLNMSMIPIVALYSIIGLFGYIQYGDKTKGSITLNMPQHNIFGHAVKLLLAGSIYISYAISNYIIYDLVWVNLIGLKFEKNENKWIYEYVARISIVLISFVFSVAIPNLELFISLLGSFCLANLGIFFPVILQTLTFWDDYKGLRFYTFLTKNCFLVIIAILGFVIGVGRSLVEIYYKVLLPSFS